MLLQVLEVLLTLIFILRVVAASEEQDIQHKKPRVRRSLACGNRPVIRALEPLSEPSSTTHTNVPDHPDWYYLNAIPWFQTDPTQQDHARFHSYLSMSAYGNYRAECPKTFTKGFTVVDEFTTPIGQTGYTAIIPEMKKVVIVFKGYGNYRSLDWNSVSIKDLVQDCTGCEAAQGIRSLYLSAKKATNDWEVAKRTVAKTGLLFSVTGHGVGGAVAALAALDLGSRDLVHYSHNQGMPRALNYQAVVRYDNMFQVLAGQSLAAENDFMVKSIPMGKFYHIGTKIKISGPKQQWLVNCYGNNENSTCLGNGRDTGIHKLYYTQIATCGSPDKGF